MQPGTTVRVHYRGTLDSGEEFDNSYQRGEPLEFVIGEGRVISGFDQAVSGMAVGDKAKVTIAAEDAYGPRHEEAIQDVPADKLPEGVSEGDMVHGQTAEGHPLAATVVSVEGDMARLDFNHPLAGCDLTFELELVEVTEPA